MIPRLYDCFPFFNELDLLELRLREMDALVHRFVLVEASVTFTGNPKPLHFALNKARFAPWIDKIIHIIVDDFPQGMTNPWHREVWQRNAIARGLQEAQPQDLVMVSDIDEIVRPDALAMTLADPRTPKAITSFQCETFLYYLNLRGNPPIFLALSPRIIARRYFKSAKGLRDHKTVWRRRGNYGLLGPAVIQFRMFARSGAWLRNIVLQKAGWHFTSLGSAEQIKLKLASYSHTEFATQDYLIGTRIEEALKNRRMYNPPDNQLEVVALDQFMPKSLRDNAEKYANLLFPSGQ